MVKRMVEHADCNCGENECFIEEDIATAKYFVTMESIYLHGVFGPFTLDEAMARADEFADDPDEDGHHDYRVRTMPVHRRGHVYYEAAKKSEKVGNGYWSNKRADAVLRASPR